MATARGLTDKPIADDTDYVEPVDKVVEVKVDATGGTHTLTVLGATTSAIAATAAAGTVQTALLALDPLDTGEVVVTGGPGNSGGTTPYLLTFGGDLGGAAGPAVTGSGASLTGGGATQTITTVTAGSDGRIVAVHSGNIITDPEDEDAVQVPDASEYPTANATELDPLAVHGGDTPADHFAD